MRTGFAVLIAFRVWLVSVSDLPSSCDAGGGPHGQTGDRTPGRRRRGRVSRADRDDDPEEAVTPQKQKRIAKLARTYLAEAGAEPAEVRFDVISIRVLAEDRALLRHHRAAFTVDS